MICIILCLFQLELHQPILLVRVVMDLKVVLYNLRMEQPLAQVLKEVDIMML